MAKQSKDSTKECPHTASSDKAITDDQILKFCNYLVVGTVETTKMMNDIQPNISWYITLKIPIKNQHCKLNRLFLKMSSFRTHVKTFVI